MTGDRISVSRGYLAQSGKELYRIDPSVGPFDEISLNQRCGVVIMQDLGLRGWSLDWRGEMEVVDVLCFEGAAFR
jgi:hypothetical protein